MSGTISGGVKTARTNKAKYGEDYYQPKKRTFIDKVLHRG